jgi:hypothetical protein
MREVMEMVYCIVVYSSGHHHRELAGGDDLDHAAPVAHQLAAVVDGGMLPIITVGEPGTQGAAVTGMQGMGVRTPSAAAVAAATIGLEGELHMPKGAILTMGCCP